MLFFVYNLSYDVNIDLPIFIDISWLKSVRLLISTARFVNFCLKFITVLGILFEIFRQSDLLDIKIFAGLFIKWWKSCYACQIILCLKSSFSNWLCNVKYYITFAWSMRYNQQRLSFSTVVVITMYTRTVALQF